MTAPGMLRIRYPNDPTVFEYRGLTRREADEQLVRHATLFASGAVLPRQPGETAAALTAPHERVANDPAAMIAEWVTAEGTPAEQITRIPLPAALSRAPGR